MRRTFTLSALLFALASITLSPLAAHDAEAQRGDGPIIYVTSQGLYYDSIVTADPLPPNGPFQILERGPNGLQTEYGPGDPQYVGGRWKMGDHYFSCPLLPPGRENP